MLSIPSSDVTVLMAMAISTSYLCEVVPPIVPTRRRSSAARATASRGRPSVNAIEVTRPDIASASAVVAPEASVSARISSKFILKVVG